MRNFLLLAVAVLTIGYVICGGTVLLNTIQDAQVNNMAPMAATVEHLANTNQVLNDRVDRAREIVAELDEANTRLKESLRQSTEMLTDQINENNKLQDQLEQLQHSIMILELKIKKLTAGRRFDFGSVHVIID